jgi:hypothetical protein
MSVTAIVHNNTICLPQGTHFPDGTIVVIEPVTTLADSSGLDIGRLLAGFVGIADDLPPDLARNLDHYLHGHSRQP